MKGWIAGVVLIVAASSAAVWSPALKTAGEGDGVRVAAQDTAGKAIFTGKGNCHVCHGMDAKGGPLAPNLTDTLWLNIEKPVTQAKIVALVKTGVVQPKQHPAPMPANGGVTLSEAEVQAVAAYVLSLSAQGP